MEMNATHQSILDERWKQNILDSIKDIADYESQQIIWLGQSEDFVSSFDESVMMLFDNFAVEEFISDENWLAMRLPKPLHEPLKKLINSLSTYADLVFKSFTRPTDAEILADPAWFTITKQAERVVQLW